MRSGYCNPTLPVTAAYNPHYHCRMYGCGCDCHQAAPAPVAGLLTPTGVLVTDHDPETPEWFAARRDGVTGTDVAKILGLSRYGNALSVWLSKREQIEDETAGEAAEWGQILEEPVAQKWAAVHHTSVSRVGVLRHVEHDWRRVSLDRLVDTCPDGDGPCALEVKTRSAFKAHEWRDGIPDDVLAQTTWGLIVTGLHHHHVAALIGGQRMQSYRVERDPVLEDYLVDAATAVWDAVRDGVPPQTHPDAEGVLLALLDRLYTDRAGQRDLPAAAHQWLEQYAQGADIERHGKQLKTQAKTALVQMLDDGDTGVLDDGIAFTYKAPAPGHTLPAAELRRLRVEQPDVFAELAAEHFIQMTTPARRFDVKKTAATAHEETAA